MNKMNCHLPQVIRRFLLLLIACCVICGVFNVIVNFTQIPHYGDTQEYLKLAKTLKVDQYRGIIYPLTITFIQSIVAGSEIPFQTLLYFFQFVAVCISVFVLSLTLLSSCDRRSILISLLSTVIVLFNPLVSHFALSIMTDSLATSFVIVFVCVIVKSCSFAISTKNRLLLMCSASVLFVLMSNLRVEKVYFAFTMFLTLILFLILINNYKDIRDCSLCVGFSVLFFFLSIGVHSYLKNVTSFVNHDRPPLSIETIVFSRVCWPNMERSYPFFTNELKQKISLQEAKKFDSHANNIFTFLTKKLADENGHRYIVELTQITAQHFPGRVLCKVGYDFIKYMLPNIAFPLEIYDVLPVSAGTSWTVSRMNLNYPKLNSFNLIIDTIQFLVFTVCVMILFVGRLSKTSWDKLNISFLFVETRLFIFLILFLAIVINAGLFSLFSGMDAHVRYALPAYTIIHTAITVFVVHSLIDFNKK